jgi:hypothetical protein
MPRSIAWPSSLSRYRSAGRDLLRAIAERMASATSRARDLARSARGPLIDGLVGVPVGDEAGEARAGEAPAGAEDR